MIVYTSPFVTRNLDTAQTPFPRGSEYEGQQHQSAPTYIVPEPDWDDDATAIASYDEENPITDWSWQAHVAHSWEASLEDCPFCDWNPCSVCGPDASHEDVNCAIQLIDALEPDFVF